MHVLCQRCSRENTGFTGLERGRLHLRCAAACEPRTNTDQSAARGLGAGTLCRYVAITRHATASELASRSADKRNGAPGRCQSRCAPMNVANVCVNRIGPIIVAMPSTLLLAPCSWPCSVELTSRVITHCSAGFIRPHSDISTLPLE